MPKLETGGRAASGGAASGVDNVAELTVSVRLSLATGRAAVSKPSAEATTTGRLGFGREGSWMSCTSSRGFRRSRTMWLDSIARMVHRPLNSRAGRRTPACCRDPPDRRWTDRRPGPRRRGSAASPGVDLLGVGAGGAEQVPAPDRRVNGGSGPQRDVGLDDGGTHGRRRRVDRRTERRRHFPDDVNRKAYRQSREQRFHSE